MSEQVVAAGAQGRVAEPVGNGAPHGGGPPGNGWDLAKAAQLYQIERWGAPYYSINGKGNVAVSPSQARGPSLDMMDVIAHARERGIQFPMVLRFQDILRNRVEALNEAFRAAIAEHQFTGGYFGVFPIKVNQLREVVEEILDAGAPYHFGLEAGSKPELAAALAMHSDPESLIVCNGYKDAAYVRLAMIGRKLGKQVILVVEKLEELAMILKVAREMGVQPLVGFRVKLQSKSAGRWAMSSGENAKFGLSALDLVEACDMLAAEGARDSFKLVHFHIGSQVPDIQIIKRAVREAARYYAKARQMGFPVQYFDVGGGLGVDYDGTRSTNDSSMNYSLEEYCADVVYNLSEVCAQEKAPHPHIVSESGRALVSQHSVLVVEVFGSSEKTRVDRPLPSGDGCHRLVEEMLAIHRGLNKRNRREALHDAQQMREQGEVMFGLGLLDLRSKAQVESLYWHIAERVSELFRSVQKPPQEIVDLRLSLGDQYICNFSVFQSLVDHWALGQLFPVMPLARLLEEPVNQGTLVDITCDSDGKISRFIGQEGERATLPLHPFTARPYCIGFFLVGAYQDVMGDIHNLFGRVNEAHVFLDPDEDLGFYIEETIRARTVGEVLTDVQYDIHELVSEMKRHVDQAIKGDVIKPSEGMRLLECYEKALGQHTYLQL